MNRNGPGLPIVEQIAQLYNGAIRWMRFLAKEPLSREIAGHRSRCTGSSNCSLLTFSRERGIIGPDLKRRR